VSPLLGEGKGVKFEVPSLRTRREHHKQPGKKKSFIARESPQGSKAPKGVSRSESDVSKGDVGDMRSPQGKSPDAGGAFGQKGDRPSNLARNHIILKAKKKRQVERLKRNDAGLKETQAYRAGIK